MFKLVEGFVDAPALLVTAVHRVNPAAELRKGTATTREWFRIGMFPSSWWARHGVCAMKVSGGNHLGRKQLTPLASEST
jgi:hypothetical protein